MATWAGVHPTVRAYAEYAMDYFQWMTGGTVNVKGKVSGGVRPTLTSGYRDLEKQAELRAIYEAGKSKYPANRPGDSAHNYGLAFDSWVEDSLMPQWIAVRRAIGFRVPDNDAVHAEVPDWRQYVGL